MRRRVGFVVAAFLVASTSIAAPAAEIPIPEHGYRAAVVIAPDEARTLYASNADVPLPAASLVKLFAALVAAERLAPADRVTISRRAAVAEADAIRWPQGAVFTVDQVLHGMLLESSNGAAIAIAERVAGSVEAALPLIANRAGSVGATHTRIFDPSGLDAPGQYSTARDVAWAAAAVLAQPWLSGIVRSTTYALRWPDGSRHTFHNKNRFMYRYKGAVGVKNGYTTQAGNCVAAAATRGGRTLVAVVLGGHRVFDDAAALLDRGFKIKPVAVKEEFAPGGARAQAGLSASLPALPAPRPPRTTLIVVAWILLAYASRVWWVRRRVVRRRRAAA